MIHYWDNINSKCGLLTCTKPGGVFKLNAQYPYIIRNGYMFLVLMPLNNPSETEFIGMIDFCDYYKVHSSITEDEEDAVFKVVK